MKTYPVTYAVICAISPKRFKQILKASDKAMRDTWYHAMVVDTK